jgi:hypothetical protein
MGMGSRAASGRDPSENPAVGSLREIFTGDTAGEVRVVVNRPSLSCWLLRIGTRKCDGSFSVNSPVRVSERWSGAELGGFLLSLVAAYWKQ